MRSKARWILGVLLPFACQSQAATGQSARDLFFSNSDWTAANEAPLMAPRRKPKIAGQADLQVGMAPLARTNAVPHLGLRYTVLLQDPKREDRFSPVDVDREFQTGDCIRFEVESNYSGYLYVFNRAASGAWQPLFPFLTPGESNRLGARAAVPIPADYCLTLKPPSGVERFFLVLGRDPEDLAGINASIENSVTSPAHSTVQSSGPSAIHATANAELGFDDLKLQLRDRDVGVKKIQRGIVPEETAQSVYVVNLSEQSVSLIVAEVRVRHRAQ